jgi:predicted enzyme related to lactoylglutathione lyase
VGTITWVDLTVPDAEAIRDFYAAVTGWVPVPVAMGGYHDYTMGSPSGAAIAGVCHARGVNADLPQQWLVYVTVADLDASITRCRAQGGTVLREPVSMGPMGRYAVIRDPAGAVLALAQFA